MTKILKHAGVEYSVDQLVAIKGQGINVKTNSEECIADSGTIISADIKKPLVMKQDKRLLILVDSSYPRSERGFEVTLISKHLLKKAKIEEKQVDNPFRATTEQGGFKHGSPWILSSESALAQLRR